MVSKFPISSDSHKIEAAAVKATLLDLGFVFDRSSDSYICHFEDGGWMSLRASYISTFDKAAREIGKFYFRGSSFGKEAYRLSQAVISRACTFEDEQIAAFASRLKI